METLFLSVIELVEGAKGDLEVASQLLFGEELGGAGGAGSLVLCDLEELGVFAAELSHEAVAHVADELASKGGGTVAGG